MYILHIQKKGNIMIIKLYEDKELTKLDRFLILSNTSKEEILNFIEQENLDLPSIIKLIETANKKGIFISLED